MVVEPQEKIAATMGVVGVLAGGSVVPAAADSPSPRHACLDHVNLLTSDFPFGPEPAP